jgi:hypothetical protein
MPRSKKKLDGVFDNPENVYQFFRKYSQSESFREWKKQIEEGPHPTTEILFDYSVGMLPDSEQEEWLEHIAHCIRCTKEVYSIRAAQRRLSKATVKSETREPNWAQILRDLISSGKMVIRSFVDRVTEVIEPEPTELTFAITTSRGFMTRGGWEPPDLPRKPTTPKRKLVRQSIETNQFLSDEEFYILMPIQRDGYVAAFTLSESGPMRLVFPRGEKVDTSVSARENKRIVFKAPEPPGPWTLKSVWTADDPFGSLDLPFDESWNHRALLCLGEYVSKSDKDQWTVEILEFEVKQKLWERVDIP